MSTQPNLIRYSFPKVIVSIRMLSPLTKTAVLIAAVLCVDRVGFLPCSSCYLLCKSDPQALLVEKSFCIWITLIPWLSFHIV